MLSEVAVAHTDSRQSAVNRSVQANSPTLGMAVRVNAQILVDQTAPVSYAGDSVSPTNYSACIFHKRTSPKRDK